MTSPERNVTPDLPVWQERFVVGEFDGARREVSFSVVNAVGEEPPPLDFVASVYCSNGRSANALKPGTRMFLEHEAIADLPFQLMDEPTRSISPDTRCEQLWNLISMINGNYWSIHGQQSATEAVKEAINLCALEGNTDASNSVYEVTITPSTAPMQIGGNVLLVPGNIIEVILDLDTLPFSGHVFAVALHTYFSSLVSYDRFFQLKVRECGREEPFKVFSRVHGSQALS